ncbi:MAG: cytochrome P450 [Anaerolineales bacterium]|nr:cytochrome P450 [Anaerolineales bacterium]
MTSLNLTEHDTAATCPLPVAGQKDGLALLATFLRERSPLAALEQIRASDGDQFQVQLPGFQAAFATGPDAARQIMVQERDNFLYRNETDPVARLLRRGVLVVDGAEHDQYRALMEPSLRRGAVLAHSEQMWRAVDWVTSHWPENGEVDMLVESRKIALIILMETLFSIDFRPLLDPLWQPIQDMLSYIGPGPWLVWSGWQGRKYQAGIAKMDSFLLDAIRARRHQAPGDDMLDALIAGGLDNETIRDQMLTMLIAGHDTATALFAWVFAVLSQHANFLERARQEARRVLAGEPPAESHLNKLMFLDTIIKETLRLFPPIHVGNRRTACPVELNGQVVPAGQRLMYSIYLAHRHPDYWQQPEQFEPARFDRDSDQNRPPFVYLPFGAGPRNCIGATFAQIEAKIVLARLLQQFDFLPLRDVFHPHMGATLEPRPGVPYKVRRYEARP